jgi:hypothetical protein
VSSSVIEGGRVIDPAGAINGATDVLVEGAVSRVTSRLAGGDVDPAGDDSVGGVAFERRAGELAPAAR